MRDYCDLSATSLRPYHDFTATVYPTTATLLQPQCDHCEFTATILRLYRDCAPDHCDLTATSATALRPLRVHRDRTATTLRPFLLHFSRRGILSMSKTHRDCRATCAIAATGLQLDCNWTATSSATCAILKIAAVAARCDWAIRL